MEVTVGVEVLKSMSVLVYGVKSI